MKHLIYPLLLFLFLGITSSAQTLRDKQLLDLDWRFALGNAADMEKDFTHGTEYFTYLSKCQSTMQSKGPILLSFSDSAWQKVDLPHDWAVDLPYSGEASHSHGYKTIGWKYPETSIGWYRKHFTVPASDEGKHVFIEFEGIFRDAQVFCNGFYLGHEPSGYATQYYDLSEYLNYGGENLITVRADASTEEGWFYEGAGIYRHVWLVKTSPVHIANDGVYASSTLTERYNAANITVATKIKNDGLDETTVTVSQRMTDADGKVVVQTTGKSITLPGKSEGSVGEDFGIARPQLWDLESPYLYTLHTDVYADGRKIDGISTRIGIRDIRFSADSRFLLNGKRVEIKGTNLHLDHAGVGVAVPDELWRYRIEQLQKIGSNAIRTSHNPASPAMLDLCDEMGMLVLDENRLMGINDEHIDLLRRMIERDRNHPCVILWSVGNEEWAIENTESGKKIARSMCEYVRRIDPTRPATAGIAGGTVLLQGLDVQGYNYIIQNNIEQYKKDHPEWIGVGTEETTGCGTRGVYYTDDSQGFMAAINRNPRDAKTPNNVIERGWKFYAERPWLGGLFYWTGIDYRGEPNPMKWPATGSQFGILDYCGFPKDEAHYLRAWWTDEPTLHILPHWNLQGHEGEKISVWAYSNCDEVELIVNGKKIGRKAMPRNGHLEWEAIYKPGKVVARGYKNGKKNIERVIETTGEAKSLSVTPYKKAMKADGEDILILDLSMLDAKKREVPTAMTEIKVKVSGAATILGYGNGHPGFKGAERPASAEKQELDIQVFSGKAQIILRSQKGASGPIKVTFSGQDIEKSEISLNAE